MTGKVVILGAGPAGLGAAWKLSERGWDVEVLEAHGYVGGLAHTIRRDGYLFDFGPHRFHSANPAIVAEIRRLMGDLPTRICKTQVYFRDNFYTYPLSAGNLLTSLSPALGAACFADFLLTRVRSKLRPATDDSFEAWVVNRFGRRLYDVYFGPYTAKVWGRDPSRLAASWAAQRVAVIDLWDLMLRVLKLRREDNDFHHSPFKAEFLYPDQGVGRIYERMAEEVERRGGRISLNSRVTGVTCGDERVESVLVEREGVLDEVRGDFFISTVPISPLVRSLRPSAPSDVLDAASQIQFRAMIFLFLMLDRPSVTEDHWIYFPDTRTVFNRISEMKNFSSEAAPPGKTSLTVEISCDVGDDVWNAPESELYQRSVRALVDAGLIRASDVSGHFFSRTRNAYPTYDLKFEANLGKLAYHLASWPNLIVCGRQGLFRYINQDHAIEMGFCAAEEIATQQIGSRVGRVGSEPVYFG
ncbi:MAG: FAD-dependent oxidoreductase [Chloroflexi bacterium]|nr:FAD-dependent oxidoreductase [Chloroflexota bacterium]